VLQLTRINRKPVQVWLALIESIDTTPDTVISLTTGEGLRVMEAADEVIDRAIQEQRQRVGRIQVLAASQEPLEN